MKIYIACDSQERGVAAAEAVLSAGHSVTSSWLSDSNFGGRRSAEERQRIAGKELDEVAESEVLLHLSSEDNVPGGKHVEFGFALARGLACVHIGRPENIFHYHRAVTRVESVQAALQEITRIERVTSET